MRPDEIGKSRVCSTQREDLSVEHFMELIRKRADECAVWERTLRSQGNLKDAEKMVKTKERMLRSLTRLNDIKSRANK